LTQKIVQYTTQQINAIQAASVLIDGPAVEISESIRKKTAKGDKNVVTGKRGNYEFVVVDNKPIGKLYYISSYSLKQATAEKTTATQRPNSFSRDRHRQEPARRRMYQENSGEYGRANYYNDNDFGQYPDRY
jgi:hypothetical protein